MIIDEIDVDSRLLRLFLTIYDLGSVTAAAEKLGVGQPTVSHGLDRLRTIIGDPLFVRAGRSVAPTAHADMIAPQVRSMLSNMRNLKRVPSFDPHRPESEASFVIGCNDYESVVILPELIARMRGYAANIRLKVVPVTGPGDVVTKLRDGQLDHAITLGLEGRFGDIAQQVLFSERMSCFYDGAHQKTPPTTLDAYCGAAHARVLLGLNETSAVDDLLMSVGRKRRTVLQVTNFASIGTLIRGTDVIATLPARLGHSVMAGFDTCDFPMAFPVYRFCQCWHVRNAENTAHKWFRNEIFRVSRGLG
ncbi:LysR family transcriptional regulator [Thalassospira sp. MA62]|nr:LysR family transcriptional regulator [Thalassospira sp. MA62]